MPSVLKSQFSDWQWLSAVIHIWGKIRYCTRTLLLSEISRVHVIRLLDEFAS